VDKLKLIVYFIFFPLRIISMFIPKNPKLIIFGSSLGEKFADNSKYLYLNLSRDSEYECYWITKSKKNASYLTSLGFKSLYLYSIKGILKCCRAKVNFITHRVDDINPLFLGGSLTVQLWHGIPLKKIGFDTDWRYSSFLGQLKYIFKKVIYFIFPYSYYMNCDRLVVPSKFVIDSYLSAFGFGESKVIISPQPRVECLDPNYILDSKLFPELLLLQDLKKFDWVLTWLPTHRRQSNTDFNDLLEKYGFDDNKFEEFLEKNNAIFIIKTHLLEDCGDRFKGRFRFLLYKYTDPYPLLKHTSILLTDYSSVYFDFLVTGRPIIFTPFDFKEYSENVGFYYDYNEFTPGPKAKNWNEVIECSDELMRNPIKFNWERLELNNSINPHGTKDCSKILINKIMN